MLVDKLLGGASDGLDKRYSVAGDVGNGYRGLVGCFSEKVQKELGVLVIPREQCALDCVGHPRSRICTDLFAIMPGLFEHPGNAKESH